MDKICFVICPIDSEGSETRKRSDQVLKHVIKPAANECGYKAVRADEISEPGMITSQVIQHVVDDPLVIADLTDRNPNVFYELALRHALKKPLVQLIQKGEQLPFDVAGMRTIPVDHRDLDSVEDARKEIISQIKSVEKKKPEEIDSPITVSLQLQQLRQSDNPEQRTLGELLSVISDIRSSQEALLKLVTSSGNLISAGYERQLLSEHFPRSLKSERDQLERDQLHFKALINRLDEISQVLSTSADSDRKHEVESVREQLSNFKAAMKYFTSSRLRS